MTRRDTFLALAAKIGELPTGALASAEPPKRRITFMDRALAGEFADPVDALHEAINAWHGECTEPDSLYEYLGMSRDEYARCVGGRGDLLGVIADRRAAR